jgi:hypothetical protein
VHNIDAPALRMPKMHALLSALAAQSGMQLAASVDYINAPLLWTSTELLAQWWLWHDMTMLAAYDVELTGADPASLHGTLTTTTAAVSMRAGAESMGMGGDAWFRSWPHWHHVRPFVNQIRIPLGRRRTCKRPTKLPAPEYVDALMNWTQSFLDDEAVFSNTIGIPSCFPVFFVATARLTTTLHPSKAPNTSHAPGDPPR